MNRTEYALQRIDGTFLACYLWSSKRAIWCGADVATKKAWRGTAEEAWKIQDQWGTSSPLRLVPFVSVKGANNGLG